MGWMIGGGSENKRTEPNILKTGVVDLNKLLLWYRRLDHAPVQMYSVFRVFLFRIFKIKMIVF